ncbi:MAG TPA: hypothetical protein VMF56_11375 [Acidobacteriaceae bacterium]|nr:hypothetical protein [Acidobacteriaceae bacterium]
MLKDTIGVGESAKASGYYDGNYAGKIVPVRRPWWMPRNVTEAQNRGLPFAGSWLQLAEQRESCIAQICEVGRHFWQMRASNRCELCLGTTQKHSRSEE